MTRDEHREKCIEALASAYHRFNKRLPAMERAFDALNGVARVVPIEATEEMIAAGGRTEFDYHLGNSIDAANYAGDLTNQPALIISRAIDPNTAHMFTNAPEKKP
jgi:hypothetical protein